MAYVYLEITLEPDDGGFWVAVFNWVEIRFEPSTRAVRIEAQPYARYDRVSLN